VNSGSCFTAGTNANCCGCPSWAPGYPGGACLAGNNSVWQTNAQPIALEFNTSSPTSYSFPFDDAIKLFACQNSSNQAVNYTVNFCPNDSDGDGVQNSQDADTDNDGVTNTEEIKIPIFSSDVRGLIGTPDDADGDGIPNELDLDSDNDGIPDHDECGGTNDADRDGRSDNHVDSDGDGHHDEHDPDHTGNELVCPDTDGDGIPDFMDIDSDDHREPDFVEHGGTDADGDGLPDTTEDANGDGLLDLFHPDTGEPLIIEDEDGDGVPDHVDAETSGDNGGSCALALAGNGGASGSALVYLVIPALIILRRKLRRSGASS
jgi:hypothetical protein